MGLTKDERLELFNQLHSHLTDKPEGLEILQKVTSDETDLFLLTEETERKNNELKELNDALTITNSKFFRQLSFNDRSEEGKKEEEEKTFSESITLESIESKGNY